MDPSHKPPNLFGNDTDSDDGYVPSTLDKGKRKAEEPSERDESVSHYRNSYHVRPRRQDVFSSDSDTEFGSDTASTPSPSINIEVRPITDGVTSDGGESLYQSVDEENSSDNEMDIDVPPLQHDELDLAYSVKGMYRILDLISEQGSGGLGEFLNRTATLVLIIDLASVDKIIISQNSLEAFVNSVSPGAYSSMIKVNFKALDKFAIKPVGVYGSKEEIVRFLMQLGAINDTIAAQLLVDPDTHIRTQPALRSGLYIITTPDQTSSSRQIFVLYWPEQTTWDDSTASSVRRNRITFMRYLTKMCDQVVSLISPEHAQTILWREGDEEEDDNMLEVDHDESDRMFTFEVAQTNEQEESVTVREGFKATSRAIALPEAPTEDPDPIKPAPITPFLLFGETTQGFMTVEHREARVMQDYLRSRSITAMQLEGFLTSDSLCLNESWVTRPWKSWRWKHTSNAIRSTSETRARVDNSSASKKLQKELPALRRSLFEAMLDELLRLYPCFDRGAFAYPGDEGDKSVDIPEPLSKLLTLYPKANDKVTQSLSKDFENITDQDFRIAKDRITLFKELVPLLKKKSMKLNKETTLQILEAVLKGDIEQAKANVRGNNGPDGGGNRQSSTRLSLAHLTTWAPSIVSVIKSWGSEDGRVDALIHRTRDAATQVSDSQILSQLEQDVEKYAQHVPLFKELADKARNRAFDYLEGAVARTLKRLTPAVHRIQEEECGERIKREHAKSAEEEQDKLRVKLIKDVNDLSTQKTACSHTLSIDNVEDVRKDRYYGWSYSTSYRISGSRASQQDPMVMYTVHLMNLTTEDQHELQLNPSAIPSPRFKFNHTFTLPLGHSVVCVSVRFT
ncbi:hypothetical protein J3R83DRAFT_3979 [Lanmaoa asiatica]|nr:hypothetical protein J3R83DRAFT_3979 [Lanmaoa asiatica]